MSILSLTLSAQNKIGLGRFKAPNQPLSVYFPFLIPLLILVIWQLTASLGTLPSSILPSPFNVLIAGFRLLKSGELSRHIGVSFMRAISGLILGGSLAFLLGLFNALSRSCEVLLDPTIQMIRNIPNLALIPLVILWFGIDESAKLFLVSLGVFFPIYINTYHGVKTVDRQLVEMTRSYGFSGKDLFFMVLLPGALPSILVGLRYALGIMWLTLIVAETIAAQSGLGYMAMSAREFMQTDVVVLAILIYALLGKTADSLVRFVENRILIWHPSYQRDNRS